MPQVLLIAPPTSLGISAIDFGDPAATRLVDLTPTIAIRRLTVTETILRGGDNPNYHCRVCGCAISAPENA